MLAELTDGYAADREPPQQKTEVSLGCKSLT